MSERACQGCKYITYDKKCPLCDSKTSTNWSGLIVVTDPDNSKLAEELNITIPGRYALKVSK